MPWNANLTGASLNIARIDARLLRVMAGPGTGKTFALKRRVTRLLEQGVDARRILAVTFTRTAALNLVKELKDLGVTGCENIEARTLHSFCFAVLGKREVFEFLGRRSRPLVTFSDHGVLQFEATPLLHDIKDPGSFGGSRDCSKRLRAFEAAWARLQSETPGWPVNPVDQQFHDVLLDWLRFHETMLIGELVPEALRYFRNNPACQELNAFDHVIVDEYQDLNRAEQVLLDHLAANGNNAVVGDQDQSIYRFRHAHPQGIVEFAATHAGTHDARLVECYRCGTRIVELAANLIRHNHPAGTPARLQPLPGKIRGEVHIVQWNSTQAEAEGLAGYIEHLVSARDVQAKDILILCPRRLLGYGIRDTLVARNIPTHSFYHEEALEPEEAQIAFTLLTLLAERQDRVSLRFWLGYGSPSWRKGEYDRLRSQCEQTGESPWDALERLDAGVLQLERIGGILGLFRELKARLAPLGSLSGTGLIDSLFPENEPWAKALREAALLKTSADVAASKMLDVLRNSVTQPEMPETGDFVRVMSLHKSKGLTSKVVIVAGCIEGLIPTIAREGTLVEQQASLQEQRRLFYVAMTRASDILAFSSVTRMPRDFAYKVGAQVRGAGGTIASRFLGELGPSAPAPKSGTRWQATGFV